MEEPEGQGNSWIRELLPPASSPGLKRWWPELGSVVLAHIPCFLPALPQGAQGETSWQEVPGHFWGRETYGVLMGEGAGWGSSIQTGQIG